MFSSLKDKQFRLFILGAFLSNVGTWMQTVAESWLVLELTNSAFFLGLNGFANTLPIALLSLWGGVIADRVNRRNLLIGTQWVMLGLALTLGILVQTGVIQVWHILVLSLLGGITQAITWPVYQAVLANVVEQEHISNAIALNSTQFNLARTLGPLVGAWGLRYFGVAGCFYANAVSFLAVIAGLIQLREIHADRRQAPRGSMVQAMTEGLRYMWSEKTLFWFLLIIATSSVFGVPLVTLLPVYARDILNIGSSGFGLLVGSFGFGAVLGGLAVAFLSKSNFRGKFAMWCFSALIAVLLIFAESKTLWISITCLIIAGFAMVGYVSVINTILQSSVPDHLRGRAMSVFVMSFGGCMPIGNLLSGVLAKHWGAPWTLEVEGMILASFAAYVWWRRPDVVQHA